MFILDISTNGTQASEMTNTDLLRLPGKTPKQTPPTPEKKKATSDGYQSYAGSQQEVKDGAEKPTLAFANYFNFGMGDGRVMKTLSRMPEGEDRNKVAKYLAHNKSEPGRFVFVKAGEEETDPVLKQFKTQLLNSLTKENEAEIVKALERILGGDKETRELMRVFAAMTFSVSNPTVAISALGSLLAVLETTAAKQLAGSEISDIADFAARQAMIKAKYDPNSDEARKLMSVLHSITVAACSCEDDSHVETGSVDDVSGQAGVIDEPDTRADKVLVYDTQKGEIVDDIDIGYLDEEDVDSCEENCAATENTLVNLEEAEDSANKGIYGEEQIGAEVIARHNMIASAKDRLPELLDRREALAERHIVDPTLNAEIEKTTKTIAIG